jgi:cobaltochelatase CobS
MATTGSSAATDYTSHLPGDVLKEFADKAEALKSSLRKASGEEPQVEEKEEPPKPFVLKDGEVLYSSLFGTSHTGTEHAVRVYDTDHWPEHVRMFIPNTNPAYRPASEALELLVVGIQQNDKIFITGPTGSGKSSLVEYVCSILKIPFVRINFSGDMDSSAIFGSPTVKGGDVVWEDGPLTTLARVGGVVMCDEISTSPSEVSMAMQWILEENGRVFLKDSTENTSDKMIIPHEDFRLIATDNTKLQGDATGKHAGTFVQNTAFLDRFQTVIELEYLSRSEENNIIKAACPDVPASQRRDMIKLANLIRNGYNDGKINLTMSPRTLINWGGKIAYWKNPLVALKISFFSKLEEDDIAMVNELVHKVYGENIA